jgi:hypothetical protein
MSFRLTTCCCLLLGAAPALAAPAGFFSELSTLFGVDAPGRVAVAHDQASTQKTDIGIAGFTDDQGRITTVARVDINHADPAYIGIGLARLQFDGPLDLTFQGTGKRVKDAAMTDVVDACKDPNGRIVVAGSVPGANGTGGARDLALVRFLANGNDDTSFAGDGGVAFTIGDINGEADEAIRDIDCLADGRIVITGWYVNGNGDHGSFLATMDAAGNPTPTHVFRLNLAAGQSQDGTAVLPYEGGIVWATQTYGASQSAMVRVMVPFNQTFTQASNLPAAAFHGSGACASMNGVQFFGMALLPDNGVDVVATGVRRDGSNNSVPIMVRVLLGESLDVNCSDISLGPSALNAYVTRPAVLDRLVFVSLGIQPLGSGPMTSRLRAFLTIEGNSSFMHAPGFGSEGPVYSGLVQWNFPYIVSTNNDRSFVQQLYVDMLGLVAVGTRVWNGADTDVAVTRFGSSGPFNNGFESD